jgi:hypothetical protein
MSSRTRPASWSPIDTTSGIEAVRSCSFLRLGDGNWVGGFVDTDGRMWDVVETPSAWQLSQVNSDDKSVTKGSSLELAIEKALGLGVSR